MRETLREHLRDWDRAVKRTGFVVKSDERGMSDRQLHRMTCNKVLMFSPPGEAKSLHAALPTYREVWLALAKGLLLPLPPGR